MGNQRRVIVALSVVVFVATVYLANWLVEHVGVIRVWPTDLLAPAGVFVVGAAFLLRDTIQRLGSRRLALAAIAVGSALSVFVSPRLALASALAFLCSEVVGLAVFALLERRLLRAVTAAQVGAAAIDSYVFLTIAFGSLAYFPGQFYAKLMVCTLALPAVLLGRRILPA